MILVSEQNSLHVCLHAFFQPFYTQTLWLCVREGILIILLIEGIILIVRLRVVYLYLACGLSLFCGLFLFYLPFFNPLLLPIDKKFKPSPSDRGFLFEVLFQNPYTFTYSCHHTAIYSFSN